MTAETIRCPLDDCGWTYDPAPSPLGADAPDAVREMIQGCRDQAVGYELRRHFANHDPRDILRTIGRLHAEHAKFAEAIAEMAVELHDNQAPGEGIVATVLRIRDERDGLHEILHEGPETVAICGSMRFYPLMLRVAEDETRAGRIVLMPFEAVSADQQDSDYKAMLDELHRAKIRMSRRIIVVSDGTGYFGDSTRGEIEYAQSLGLTVSFQSVEGEQ